MKALIILSLISLNSHALELNIFDGLFGKIKPGELLNCDSEDLKEHRKYDYKNPPKYYFNKNHWLKQLEKAKKQGDYCRQSQINFHLYNAMTHVEYRNYKGHLKVVENLLAGNYFLELQWQVRNYREVRGENEYVEYMQVKSYWYYINRLNKDQRCVAPKGYYTDPRTKKDFKFTTEAHLSTNDFLNKFPNSKYSAEVKKMSAEIKDARVLGLICETQSVQRKLNARNDSKNTAYNYFPLYKRLSQVVANYQESHRIDEAIYMLIGVCNKLDQKTKNGVPPGYTYAEHPDNFIFDEDWIDKANSLKEILRANFPNSQWTKQI
jgi:hypothetical protein